MAEQAGARRAEAMDDLVEALQTFTVETDVFVDGFARMHTLGRSDLNAIMWISRSSRAGTPLGAGELAARLGLGAPATTALIDRLERSGHVRRERGANDRRRVTLAVQEPALALAMAFFRPLGERMDEAVADLDTADLETAARVVHLLTAAVTATRTGQGVSGVARVPAEDEVGEWDEPGRVEGHRQRPDPP